MDCKILKKTLFISILAISLFYTGEVRAAKKCTTTYTSKPAIEKTKMIKLQLIKLNKMLIFMNLSWMVKLLFV